MQEMGTLMWGYKRFTNDHDAIQSLSKRNGERSIQVEAARALPLQWTL
jgi:hypothetical protein